MKKSLILVPLAVAILLGISPSKATNPKIQASVVILEGYERWISSASGYTCNGTGLRNYSASSNAPAFHRSQFISTSNGVQDDPNAVELAQVMADLLEQGYRIDRVINNVVYLVRQ